MRIVTAAWICNVVALASCGTMVAPTDGAAGDGSDARLSTVRFRVQTSTGTSLIAAAGTVVRVENAARSTEVRADGDGVVALDLEPDSRWSLTFARPSSQVVSILDFVVPSSSQVIDVFLPPLPSAMPLLTEFSVHARYPNGSTPIHIRGRLRNATTSSTEIPRVVAYPYSIITNSVRPTGEFDIVVASFPGAPPLDVIAYESVYGILLPPNGRQPLRAVIRRLDPRPTTDTTLDIDMAESVPCPPPTNVTLTFSREGVVTYSSIWRFDRASAPVFFSNPNGDYGEFNIVSGEVYATQDDRDASVSLRHTRVSELLPFSDDRGILGFGSLLIASVSPNHPLLDVSIRTHAQLASTLSVPTVREVVGEGGSLGDFAFRVDGDFAQFGVEITGFDGQGLPQPVWTVWVYGAANQRRAEPYRLPRLPEGVSVASLAPTATMFTATTFVSTLPASQPGYGFWRPAAESVRVAHQLPVLPLGR
jgi:hypothetical protein